MDKVDKQKMKTKLKSIKMFWGVKLRKDEYILE